MIEKSEVSPLPFEVREKLLKLESLLKEQNPSYETALAELHKLTFNKPEYVYAMTDEEFATIVAGYERYTNISISVGKVSKKSGSLLTEDSV